MPLLLAVRFRPKPFHLLAIVNFARIELHTAFVDVDRRLTISKLKIEICIGIEIAWVVRASVNRKLTVRQSFIQFSANLGSNPGKVVAMNGAGRKTQQGLLVESVQSLNQRVGDFEFLCFDQ